MTPVVSTNVRSVGYDRLTATMRVEFKNGGVYDYYGVSPELVESMLLPNPWRRLGRLVREHRCNRVG
ncbi:KTSC domain-containing protein [Arthrobacter liuii]